jgi:SAM-dependent methyltransferase
VPSEQRIDRRRLLPQAVVRLGGAGRPIDRVLSLVKAGDRVLDFGCGDAYMREPLTARGAAYAGIDPYSARADLVASLPLPLADACVDVVVAWGVLHLLDNPLLAMREFGRVLRPGGCVVGYVAFLEDMQEVSRFQISFKGVEVLAAAAGLRLAEIEAGGFGIDYQVTNLLLPFGALPLLRRLVRVTTRATVSAVTQAQAIAYATWKAARRGESFAESRAFWNASRRLAFASGYSFVMVAPGTRGPAPDAALSEIVRSPLGPGDVRQEGGWLVDEARDTAWPVVDGRYLLLPEHARPARDVRSEGRATRSADRP